MDRGAAMLAVVLDVYEGGKDLIPGWTLKEHAESALATGGIEGLRQYYEACLTGSGHRVKTTLERDRRKTLESERERFISIYLGAVARSLMTRSVRGFALLNAGTLLTGPNTGAWLLL